MSCILQVVQHLRPGGIETLVLDLCNFNKSKQPVFIVSLEGNLESALATWPRLKAMRNQLIFLDKQPGITLSLIAKLVKVIKQMRAQTVHCHHIGPLLYAGTAARLAGVPHLIHTEHDAWHLHDLKRRLLQRGTLTITKPTLVADAQTVADNMRVQLQYRAPINVISNGIDSEHFLPGDQYLAREQLHLPSDVQIIGCSGRMEEVKGQAVLISALAELPSTIHLALAGSGSIEAQLRQQVAQLGLQQRVHFLGHLDRMPTFYQALDLFCLPSLNEGFPLAPLEAQSCNIVTLVTDVGGAKETLCPDSGKFIPANNSHAMAAMLLTMLENPSAVKPRAYIQQYADVRVMANAYANLHTPTTQGENHE